MSFIIVFPQYHNDFVGRSCLPVEGIQTPSELPRATICRNEDAKDHSRLALLRPRRALVHCEE